MTLRVAIAPSARAAWPWLPPVAPPGAVLVGPTGEVLRIRPDGGADPIGPPGHPRPGIAADPCATTTLITNQQKE